MFQTVCRAACKGATRAVAVKSVPIVNYAQVLRPTSQIALLNTTGLRQFSFFSDFKQIYKEEMAKSMEEAKNAEKKPKEEAETEATKTEEAQPQSVDETAGSEATAEKVAEETAKTDSDAVNAKKEKIEEAKKEAKAKADEAKAKLDEQLNEAKKGMNSFWNEFSGELKKELGMNTEKPKKAKKPKKVVKKNETREEKRERLFTFKKAKTEKEEPKVEKKEPKSVPKEASSVKTEEQKEKEANHQRESINLTEEEIEEQEAQDEEKMKAQKESIRKDRFQRSVKDFKKYISNKKINVKEIFTVDYMKNWFQEAWTELKTGKKVKHRIVIDPEELERIKKEQKERQEAADKLKEEAEKNGTKVRTELVVSTGEENVWTKIVAILENAPIIDSIREASKKMKESRVGETITFASEDLREKWETSQHPLVYKAAMVYDELFAESDIVKAVKQVQRTDPTFTEYELRDELQRNTIPKLMHAFLSGDKAVLETVLTEHAWAQCSQVISLKEQEGIYEDPTILAIKQIEFVGAQVKERENPYFLYQCSIHKINCVRNKEGEVIEGKPDEIKNVYYMFALHQELNEMTSQMEWKVAEIQAIAALDTL